MKTWIYLYLHIERIISTQIEQLQQQIEIADHTGTLQANPLTISCQASKFELRGEDSQVDTRLFPDLIFELGALFKSQVSVKRSKYKAC